MDEPNYNENQQEGETAESTVATATVNQVF
jgi:hypothetical protein